MDHGSHGGDEMMCPMIMSFHAGSCETMLWPSWVASKNPEFALSCLAWFAMAVIFEFLKFLREKYYIKIANAERSKMISLSQMQENGCHSNAALDRIDRKNKTLKENLFNAPHLIQCAMHFIQIALGYILMLIVMTFNYYLCLSVVLGATVGYFLFGWIKQSAMDADHCC